MTSKSNFSCSQFLGFLFLTLFLFQGDSVCYQYGGWVIAGVTSGRSPAWNVTQPSVYTRVSAFSEWIKSYSSLYWWMIKMNIAIYVAFNSSCHSLLVNIFPAYWKQSIPHNIPTRLYIAFSRDIVTVLPRLQQFVHADNRQTQRLCISSHSQLSEPMMVWLPAHICVTRPNTTYQSYIHLVTQVAVHLRVNIL